MDTDRTIEGKQLQIFRSMAPAKKLSLSLELSNIAIELLKSGIRQRCPDYTDKQVEQTLKRILLTDALFAKIYRK